MAVQAVLLWPRRDTPAGEPVPEDRWPMLVIVLADRDGSPDPSLRRLYALLDRSDEQSLTVLEGNGLWSVLQRRELLLRLALRAELLNVDILMPAQLLSAHLSRLSWGGALALTTRRHADRLTTGCRVSDAFRGLVLVNCPPSTELAALARAQPAGRHRAKPRDENGRS